MFLFVTTTITRYVSSQQRTSTPASNGLCRSCNLNQELKISQLAKYPRDGEELEEYREHLERVYRLCPHCEDFVSSKLSDQDSGLAAKVIAWKLERSRLNSSKRQEDSSSSSSLIDHLHILLSLIVLILLSPDCQHLVPVNCMTSYITAFDHLFPHLTPSQVVSQLVTDWMYPGLAIIIFFNLISSVIKNNKMSALINIVMLVLQFSSASQLSEYSFILASVGVLINIGRKKKYKLERNSKKKFNLPSDSNCVLTPAPVSKSRDDTLTHDLLNSSDSIVSSPSFVSLSSPSPIQYPLKDLVKQSQSGLLKSTDELSFNHEFATGEEQRDCDLSSLSLGEAPSRPASASPFHLRSYSTASDTSTLFTARTRSRPLIQPARLTSTSWVAGGYWKPPTSSVPGLSLSRSSSQSSGFISGAPSIASYPPTHSVFSDPINFVNYPPSVASQTVGLRRRTIEESISDSSCANPGQEDQDRNREKKEKSTIERIINWKTTVTISTVNMMFVLFVCANVSLAVFNYWCLKSNN